MNSSMKYFVMEFILTLARMCMLMFLILKGLRDKSMWLTLEDGTETTVGWLSKEWTNKKSGKAKIRLDEDMTPYLFDLQEKFLAYGVNYTPPKRWVLLAQYD